MNWHTSAEFFAMGGYALYVWGSFIVCVLAVVIETLLVRQRRRTVLRSLRREQRARKIDKEGNAA